KIKTTFMCISNTHQFEFSSTKPGPFKLPLPSVDVLHAGDLSHVGGLMAFKEALQMLSLIPADL
ncbi:hypothetical protein B0J14DRAFT_429184, partial [Halenospora varia]